MKNLIVFFSALALIATIASCSKENSVPPDTRGNTDTTITNDTTKKHALEGTWKVLTMDVDAKSIDDIENGGNHVSTESYSNYKPFNLAGSLTFTDSSMVENNIQYGIHDTIFVHDFNNSVETGNHIVFFNRDEFPISETCVITYVGTDSLTFDFGDAISLDAFHGLTRTNGAKYEISGDILTMRLTVDRDITTQSGDNTQYQHNMATTILTLQRN
jgi:hypothetical protein